MIIILPSYFCKYTFGSDLHLWNFFERRKASILEYHSLRAYFNPYSDFFSLRTKDGSMMYPRLLHVYLLMNISMQKGWLNIHMMHFPVLRCRNWQEDGVHFCNPCKSLMVVHTLDLGESFLYQNFLVFVGSSISINLSLKKPLALN